MFTRQVMMPKGSAELRARQSSSLAGVIFEKQTDAKLGELISSLQAKLARCRSCAHQSVAHRTALFSPVSRAQSRISP